MDLKNRKVLIILIAVSALSFILIFLGLKVVSGAEFLVQNALPLLGFCILLGIVSSLLYRFHLKYAFYIFNAGLLVGLFEMYRSFFKDLNGWEDLAALASLFIWLAIGLLAGLLVQLGFYFYRKFKKGNIRQ